MDLRLNCQKEGKYLEWRSLTNVIWIYYFVHFCCYFKWSDSSAGITIHYHVAIPCWTMCWDSGRRLTTMQTKKQSNLKCFQNQLEMSCGLSVWRGNIIAANWELSVHMCPAHTCFVLLWNKGKVQNYPAPSGIWVTSLTTMARSWYCLIRCGPARSSAAYNWLRWWYGLPPKHAHELTLLFFPTCLNL